MAKPHGKHARRAAFQAMIAKKGAAAPNKPAFAAMGSQSPPAGAQNPIAAALQGQQPVVNSPGVMHRTIKFPGTPIAGSTLASLMTGH